MSVTNHERPGVYSRYDASTVVKGRGGGGCVGLAALCGTGTAGTLYTFNRYEEAVTAFLARHPDFALEPVEAPWFRESAPGMYRLWPHRLLGEGHFAAVLRKMGCDDAPAAVFPGAPLPESVRRFLKELGIRLPPGQPVTFGQTLYWMPPEMPPLHRLKVLRAGLELGTVKKDRFEPSHALALWLSGCARTLSLPPDGPRMAAYLHGEALPCAEKGWLLVTAGAYPIGWGKGDGSLLKNHYPKGLRK